MFCQSFYLFNAWTDINEILTKVSSSVTAHGFFGLTISRRIVQGPCCTCRPTRPINMYTDNLLISDPALALYIKVMYLRTSTSPLLTGPMMQMETAACI